MKSIVICEGNSDLTLIQYFMEKVYGWGHISKPNLNRFSSIIINQFRDAQNVKWFQHTNQSMLCIVAAGGVSKIPGIFSQVLDMNKLGTIEKFRKIAVITDRDDHETENSILGSLVSQCANFGICYPEGIHHDSWNQTTYSDMIGDHTDLSLLLLVIPFEETGSMETFLLNALSERSVREDGEQTDKLVIDQCCTFIDNIDCKEKYLCHRKEKTKAKFATVFTVMTPAEAFPRRQSILRSIPWEDYEVIQTGFRQLYQLSQE